MGNLPPIIEEPAARSGWDIAVQTFLQLPIKIEIRTIREPIDSILLKGSRCVGRKSHVNCGGFGAGVGFLIRVMHAFPFIACDDLDVNFMTVVFVEICTVACASNCAGLDHSAYATIKNIVIMSRDFGSEDGRCSLSSWYLQLQTSTTDGYIGGGVKLRVWG